MNINQVKYKLYLIDSNLKKKIIITQNMQGIYIDLCFEPYNMG